MSDVALGIKITGDARGATSEIRATRQEVKALAGDTDAANQAIAGGRKATEDYANALKKQYESLGTNTKAQKDFSDSLKNATGETVRAQGAHQGLTQEIFKGVSAVEIIRRAWDQAVATFREVVDVTEQAQQSQARITAVLRANAGASGQTADSINRLAQGMAQLTQFDDTSIRNAAAQLLIFKDVSSDAFERIIKLSADLASTGKGDLQQWVTLFAKVGTAPAETIGILERALGKLDLQTKVAIMSAAEMGDKSKAIAIATGVAAQAVGGAAVESYRGLTRQIEGTKKAWTELEIAMGNKVFDANSKDASKLEQDLRHLKDFIEEDHWFEKVIVAFFGGNPYSAGNSPQALQQQLQDFRALLADAQRRGDPTSDLQQNIAMLESRINAARAVASTADQERYRMKPNDGPQPGPSGSLFTPSGQNEMRQQQLQALQSLNDARYQLLEQAMQRELQINQQGHEQGLESEAEYYAKLAQLGTQQERNDVARIQRDIELQKQIVGAAGAQVGFAKSNNDPQAVLAAQKALNAEKDKQTSLEVQLAGAEAKVGDAARNANAEQMKAALDQVNRLEAIKRSGEDSDIALQKQTDDLQLQLDLVNKSQLQAALITNQHKLDVALADEERKIRQQIVDLQRTTDGKDHRTEIETLGKQLEDLPDKYKAVADAQASIISQTTALQQQSSVYNDLGDRAGRFLASLASGGSVFQKLLKEAESFAAELLSIFGKRWTLELIASATGNPGLLGQAAAVGQGTVAGAAGNMLSSAGSSVLGSAFGGSMIGSGSMVGEFATGLTSGLVPGMGMAGEVGAAVYGAMMAVPVWGWIAAGLVALAVAFKDSGENWKGKLGFGANAQAYTSDGPFGREGFQYIEGSDKTNHAIQQFMESTHPLDRQIARQLSGEQIATITSNLGGSYTNRNDGQPAEMSFGKGDDTAFNQFTLEYVQKKYGTIFDEINSKFAQHIRDFTGNAQDLLAQITQFITAFDQLKESVHNVDDMITSLTGTPVQQVQASMAAMDRAVSRAQQNFNDAIDSGDPQQELAAEQALTTAVMNRYNSEIQMVRQLQQAIEQLKQQGYEFAVSIAQRINSVGGSRDIGALALGRATTIRAGIGGSANLAGQWQGIQQFVGAIDTWYSSRRDAIMKDAQAQQAAFASWQQAQAAAYQARIAAIQSEIQLTQQWKGLLDQVTKVIDDMRLTSINPISAAGRYQMAQGDAAIARAAYTSATGVDRVTAGQRYVDSLQRQLGLLGETYQRPSNEYQQGYNEIIRQLTEVQGGAKTESEKVLELQDQLVKLQGEANAIASMQFDASGAANAELDALNAEALGYYTWAEREGTRVNAALILQNQQQLDAITGGQDVELFIADKQKEAVDLLRAIKEAVEKALLPGTAATNTGGGDNGGGSNGGGGGGGDGANAGTKIVVVTTQLTSSDVLKAAERGAPELARMLQRTGVL